MLMSILTPNVLGLVVKMDQLAETLVTTLIFVVIGLLFFMVAYFILSKVFNLRHEIEEDHNTALAVIIGAIMIGISIIIAAAIHG